MQLSKITHLFSRKDIPYIILALILGTVNHFLYDFFKQNPFTALITPVNESVWEHLKLLFFPVLFLTYAQYYLQEPRRTGFFGARFIGVFVGMLSVVGFYYSYKSLLGRDYVVIDILLFVFGMLLTFFLSAHIYPILKCTDSLAVFFSWFFMTLLFFIFTCYPPDFFLFYLPE